MRLAASIAVFIAFLATGITSLSVHAQYYKTLPKGVRAAVYRNIQTSDINSTYNKSSSLNPISYRINVNSQTIAGIEDPTVAGIFNYVEQVYPEGFSKLSAGAFKISGSARLNVDAYGLAYGISDKVTFYGALPIYKADVKMKYKRTKQNNFSEVADLYSTETGNDLAQGFGSIFENTPDLISGSTIQNLITENYGYRELGDWSGQGPGDLELGIMYNFLERDTYGLMVTAGTIAPTGKQDDPDILQDIPFGDGQWDAFVEFGGGYRLQERIFLNSYARYTYQFASQKELRIPGGMDNSLSDSKGSFREKLGNKLLLDVDADYQYSDWINFNAAYIFENIDQATYESSYGEANDWLANNTDSSSHNLRFKAEVTSVSAFMQEKFLLPAQIKFFYQTTLQGVNTPKVDRYEVEFRMFF